jgi:hypothetical protein
MYSITINGVDRTGDILAESIDIDDQINDQVNTCNLMMIDRSGGGIPAVDQEIIITLASGDKLFAGRVLSVNINQYEYGVPKISLTCVDYTRDLDKMLAHIAYEDKTDKYIIEDLIATYCAGSGITTDNVIEDATISSIVFNYVQLSEVLRQLCDLTGNNWYIDYDKDIHYFPLTQEAAPFNITASGNEFKNLVINRDGSQLKNRIYVRGGTKLSDPTTYSVKGDGSMIKFVLPDKPHAVTVTVNGSAKTVGIKNVHLSGYDFYLNFEEKYLEQDSGGSVLTTSDTLEVTYSYDIPILIAQEDTASIAASGVHEYAIFDTQIATTDAARARAIAELTDYANSIIEGSFTTMTTGFHSGQYLTITHSGYGLTGDAYIIQKVNAQAVGNGVFEYHITLASAKTMGIIRFLIETLENNRNLIQLDPNEVVDELMAITDSLPGGSLTDTITDTVNAPPYTWGAASANPFRWALFQWKA